MRSCGALDGVVVIGERLAGLKLLFLKLQPQSQESRVFFCRSSHFLFDCKPLTQTTVILCFGYHHLWLYSLMLDESNRQTFMRAFDPANPMSFSLDSAVLRPHASQALPNGLYLYSFFIA
jgi:hypothetical protein